MLKKLFLLLLIVACSACTKNQQKSACGTQVCTDIFASVGVLFKDKNNNAVDVTNYSVVDLRTNLTLTNVISTTGNSIPGARIVVDDSNLKDLTTDGDNIKVSATNPATNEIQTATFKIAGGCNCHVSKISGPDVIVFTK
jgi:hypothetical protein